MGDLQGICVLGKIANVARGRVKSDVVYEDIVGILDTHMSSGSVHDTKAAKGRIIGRHKDSRRSSVIEGIVPKSPRSVMCRHRSLLNSLPGLSVSNNETITIQIDI